LVKIRKQIFKKSEHSAIVMELGKENLYKYWQNAMAKFGKNCDEVSETIFFYILREISLGLHEMQRRSWWFIYVEIIVKY